MLLFVLLELLFCVVVGVVRSEAKTRISLFARSGFLEDGTVDFEAKTERRRSKAWEEQRESA